MCIRQWICYEGCGDMSCIETRCEKLRIGKRPEDCVNWRPKELMMRYDFCPGFWAVRKVKRKNVQSADTGDGGDNMIDMQWCHCYLTFAKEFWPPRPKNPSEWSYETKFRLLPWQENGRYYLRRGATAVERADVRFLRREARRYTRQLEAYESSKDLDPKMDAYWMAIGLTEWPKDEKLERQRINNTE